MENRLLSLKWNNHQATFFEILKFLREKASYTDATLAVDGKLYPVHKLVMSSCSDYFRDIFDNTHCKSPVIVLKDVIQQDLEALLDYMYLGEVNVNQNSLASLLKTAEGLKIKGLGSPDEEPTKLCKGSSSTNDANYPGTQCGLESTSSNDNWTSPTSSKRRRLDSNASTKSPNSANVFTNSSHKPLSSSSGAGHKLLPLQRQLTSQTALAESYTKDDETHPVNVDTNKSRSSTEHEYPRSVKIEKDSNQEMMTDRDDLLPIKIEKRNSDESPLEVFEGNYNYEGSTANSEQEQCRYKGNTTNQQLELEQDHPGEDFWSDIYETDYEPENYANTFYPGSFIQHKDNVDTNSGQENPYASDFEWTKETTLKFIEIYKKLPCLWQIKNHAYKDRNERRMGYIKIQKAFPNLSLNCVRRKINIIRTQYRRELRLYLLSKESGASADQIYKPRLWFFNHINFLSEGEMMTENSSLD